MAHFAPRTNHNCIVPSAPPRSSLSEEEKAHLRGRLLHLVAQQDQQLAVQVAVVFGKVARHDFPRAWPTLFADLLAKLQVGVRCVGRHPARQGGAGPWSACVALCSGAACALERAAGVWWGWIDWLHALLLPPP